MFYGYNSEANMRKEFPADADHFIEIATKSEMRVCNPHKRDQFVSFSDGKYHYKDGTSDAGVMEERFVAKHGPHLVSWS